LVAVGYNSPERGLMWSLCGKTHQIEASAGRCGAWHTSKRLQMGAVGYNTPERGFSWSLWGITHQKEVSAGRCGV
jgi:hypothetical protein